MWELKNVLLLKIRLHFLTLFIDNILIWTRRSQTYIWKYTFSTDLQGWFRAEVGQKWYSYFFLLVCLELPWQRTSKQCKGSSKKLFFLGIIPKQGGGVGIPKLDGKFWWPSFHHFNCTCLIVRYLWQSIYIKPKLSITLCAFVFSLLLQIEQFYIVGHYLLPPWHNYLARPPVWCWNQLFIIMRRYWEIHDYTV